MSLYIYKILKSIERMIMCQNYRSLHQQMLSQKQECLELAGKIANIGIAPELPFAEFFSSAQATIVLSLKYAMMMDKDPSFTHTAQAELEAFQAEFYAKAIPGKGYESCLGNPDYAVSLYGAQMGGLLSSIYSTFRSFRQSLILDNYPEVIAYLHLFEKLHTLAQEGNGEYQTWLRVYRETEEAILEHRTALSYYHRMSPDCDYYRRIVMEADLGDIRYLYRYPVFINQHDLAMAAFIARYPETDLKALAGFIIQSWIDGFVRAKKDYTKKKYANLIIPCGMERLGRMVITGLAEKGIEAIVTLPMNQSINKQYGYDHRFDIALILDRELMEKKLGIIAKFLEANQDMIKGQAGPVYIELFGEEPFSPESKATALKLSPEQQQIYREMNARNAEIYYRYYRRDEASFTIIAFPSPEIGEKFPEIFADTLKINLLDSNHYARIQQKIIDVLDTAEYVHVKGKAGNDTDIMVRMHPITDPATQTNFENCVADVNIPVGEVFTSPLLTGTNGVLHVEDIYLGSLRYYNLRIKFTDGWVESYSCSNFDNAEDGSKYIHENLLLPHDTLPIGEFAIGTNTTAYQIARKHDILALLPILIIEKMGPHFAIGDTCFSHEEDAPHPSFMNGKEMIAVDNEKSRTRDTDPMNAYTQKHMDITLPYEMLESITAITKDCHKAEIIRDGRFVVPGTEELNIPLDEGW